MSLTTGISSLILSKEAYSPNRPPKNRVLEGGNLVLGEVEYGISNWRDRATSRHVFDPNITFKEIKSHSGERRDLIHFEVQIPARQQHEGVYV